MIPFLLLAVQDERGPRKSKTSKIPEINTIVPKNWKTRSKKCNTPLIIPFVTSYLRVINKFNKFVFVQI